MTDINTCRSILFQFVKVGNLLPVSRIACSRPLYDNICGKSCSLKAYRVALRLCGQFFRFLAEVDNREVFIAVLFIKKVDGYGNGTRGNQFRTFGIANRNIKYTCILEAVRPHYTCSLTDVFFIFRSGQFENIQNRICRETGRLVITYGNPVGLPIRSNQRLLKTLGTD